MNSLIHQTKGLANHLLTIGENRLQLWFLELEEERVHVQSMIMLGIGVAIFSLLAGVALSGCLVVLLWSYSPLLAFASLVILYGILALALYLKLVNAQRDRKPMEGSLDQLKKDRLCLEKLLT